jgi:type IV secretion system protein VirB11
MDSKDKRIIEKLRREMGSTIRDALNDPKVIEVMLNDDGELWVERVGEPIEHLGHMDGHAAYAMMTTIASANDTMVSPDNPTLETVLPESGERFQGEVPPKVKSPAFTIRKPADFVFTLSDYVEQGAMSEDDAEIIRELILRRDNIAVVGGTGSGKTTLVNTITQTAAELTPDHRFVVLEDTPELKRAARNSLMMRTTMNQSMQQLLVSTLRHRPDRIIVGEVRDGAALDLIDAWSTGHKGGISTWHANEGGIAALNRLERLIRKSQNATPGTDLKLDVSEAVDAIIYISKDEQTKKRRVTHILAVHNGLDENGNYRWSNLRETWKNARTETSLV